MVKLESVEELKEPEPKTDKTDVTDVAAKRGRKPTNAVKALESPLSKDEVQRRITSLLNGASMVAKSEARFTNEDSSNIAAGILDVCNIFPPFRAIIRLLGPLSIIGDVIDKIRTIREKRKNATKLT